jgi:hypothetical protein
LQRDGKLLIGGNFNIQLNGYNGSGPYDARYVARLNSDGTLDPTFTSNVDFSVGSLVIQKDRKVLIGGTFASIDGVPRNGMARLAGDVGLTALTPSAAYAGGPAFDIAVAGYGFELGAKVLWNGMDRSTTFVSSTELVAAISSDDLATGVEIAVASVRVQNSDGQLTNPLGFSIVAQTVGTTESAVAEPGESTAVSTAPTTEGDAGVSVTVQNGGEGPVTVLAATYDEEPVGDSVFEVVAGTFVDVQIVGANEHVVATVAFYYPSTVTGDAEASLALNYYDGTEWISVLSSGGVPPTKDTTDNLDGTVSGGRFTVTFDMTSTPSILDLGGTVFVMFDTAPQVGTITGPVGPVALVNPITLTATYGAFGATEVSMLNFIWGDGTYTPVDPGIEGLATATHLYSAPGVYTVTVQVISVEGTVREGRFEYVVIYDPNGGFVTGGGWIHSPAGAYLPDPALSGRATFGFNSRYQTGRSVPDGNTQFQFQAAGLRFQSTAYEWLVVSGAKAQYKGTGQVHGAGDYGFLLTATDGPVSGGGGADRFRIKIWDRKSGLIIYDNALGEPDDLNNANPQVIGGGSIVIHKSK